MTAPAIDTLVEVDVSDARPLGTAVLGPPPIGAADYRVPMNAVQINIALLIDTEKALRSGKLENGLYMVDNSVDAAGQPSGSRGTAKLCTSCTQGMVLNWFAFAIAGTITPMITNIEFLERPVCEKLMVYGAPAIDRSPSYVPCITPVYNYWAGIVLPEVPRGRYYYRLDVRLGAITMSVSTPSLDVAEIPKQFETRRSEWTDEPPPPPSDPEQAA